MIHLQGERVSLAARLCLVLFFSLAVNFYEGNLVLAQQSVFGQEPGTNAEENPPAELAFIGYLLQHRKELNLSPAQVINLELERTAFQKLSQKKRAELQVVEAQLSQQRAAEPLDLKAIEEKFRQSDAIKTEIRIAAIKAIEKAKALLRPDQLNKLEPLLKAAPTVTTPGSSPDPKLRQQIETVLKEEYKDQKQVELETSEAVVAKLMGWATTFGVVLGAPITLILALLGLFGFKSLSDVRALMSGAKEDFAKTVSEAKSNLSKTVTSAKTEFDKSLNEGKRELSTNVKNADKEIKLLVGGSKKDIEEKLKEAQDDAEEARTKGNTILLAYENLEKELAQIQELKNGLKALTNKVESIEEVINVEYVKASSSNVKHIIPILKPYQEYFRIIGFPPAKGKLDIQIIGGGNDRHNAFYDPENNRLTIGESVVHDQDVVYHEYTHHILVSNVDRKVCMSPKAYGVQEGLADYYTGSFKGKPEVGEKIAKVLNKFVGKNKFPNSYLRNLDNKRSFEELKTALNPLDEGNIWGGAFWELRGLLGQQTADKLLLTTWTAIKPADVARQFPVKFVKKLLKTYQPDGNGKDGKEIQAIFERRGLKLD